MYLVIKKWLDGSGLINYTGFESKTVAVLEILENACECQTRLGVDWPTPERIKELELTSDFELSKERFYFVDEMEVTKQYIHVVTST